MCEKPSLPLQGGNDKSFICAQYNKTFRFFTATFNNGSLNVTTVSISTEPCQHGHDQHRAFMSFIEVRDSL